jgi:hypothetical protein
MFNASDLTNRRNNRVLYADRVIQQTTFDKGLKKYIVLEGGQSGAMTYPTYIRYGEGGVETTLEERESYVNSVNAADDAVGETNTPVITIPDPPTSISATGGDTQATVTFIAPANNGGSEILSYTVTSSPGGITATGSASPITVTGLTNGTPYTFTVVATNSVGDSASSSASTAVTPNIALTRTVFTSGSGTWTAPSGVTSVDYLLVGGGGGGGGGSGTGSGGGGGGGSVKTGTLSVTPGESYNYTVGSGGAGGAGSSSTEVNGIAGADSVFDVVTANGGGLGYRSREKNSSDSYGAGGNAQSGDTPTTGGSGGNVRDGGGENPNDGAAGGGGGAGGAGVTTTSNGTDNNRGGAGGAGISSNLKDGSSLIYGAGGKGADEGTTGFIGISSTTPINIGLPGANGAANTGNGGGGGASHFLGGNGAPGGTGGSGIVVLNYYM